MIDQRMVRILESNYLSQKRITVGIVDGAIKRVGNRNVQRRSLWAGVLTCYVNAFEFVTFAATDFAVEITNNLGV